MKQTWSKLRAHVVHVFALCLLRCVNGVLAYTDTIVTYYVATIFHYYVKTQNEQKHTKNMHVHIWV